MEYAPIIIPTLNRYVHLKRCIESLKRNALAQETDIYVSVDYPPSEKYVEGYTEIKNYLKDGISGFKNSYIIYQEQNLGARGNGQYLMNTIKGKYETYIFTEDDNEFSPAFLEYINEGLRQFKNDYSVVAICGYSDIYYKSNDTVRKDYTFAAWGYGSWFEKYNIICSNLKRETFIKYLRNGKFCRHLFIKFPNRYWQLVESILADYNNPKNLFSADEKNMRKIDYNYGIVMIANDLFSIRPNISLVRNWGLDGTGMNCQKSIDEFEKQELYNGAHYDIVLHGGFQKVNVKVSNSNYSKRVFRAFFLRYIYLIFGEQFARKIKDIDDKVTHKSFLIKKRLKKEWVK